MKIQKNKRNIWKFVTTRTPFLARYAHPRDPTTVQKRSFSPTHCFLHTSPGLPMFSDLRSYPKRPRRQFWARGPIPKVLFMRCFFFFFDFFHFLNTRCWESVVKVDRVRSCLVERQSLFLRNSQIAPVHCTLMYFPICL